MYNVQDYRVLSDSAFRTVICVDRHFAHILKLESTWTPLLFHDNYNVTTSTQTSRNSMKLCLYKPILKSFIKLRNAISLFFKCVTENPNRFLKVNKKNLKITKGQSESVNRRTVNTMTKSKRTKGQTTIYKTYT